LKAQKYSKKRYKNNNALELLDILENMLNQKKQKPTGLNMFTLPDVDWLCTVLHKEDPNDSYNVFKRPDLLIVFNREINEKFAQLLQDEHVKTGLRGAFKKTKAEKEVIKLKKIEKRITRKLKKRDLLNRYEEELLADLEVLKQKKQRLEDHVSGSDQEVEDENEADRIEEEKDMVESLDFENKEVIDKVDIMIKSGYSEEGKITPGLLKSLMGLLIRSPLKSPAQNEKH